MHWGWFALATVGLSLFLGSFAGFATFCFMFPFELWTKSYNLLAQLFIFTVGGMLGTIIMMVGGIKLLRSMEY